MIIQTNGYTPTFLPSPEEHEITMFNDLIEVGTSISATRKMRTAGD